MNKPIGALQMFPLIIKLAKYVFNVFLHNS